MKLIRYKDSDKRKIHSFYDEPEIAEEEKQFAEELRAVLQDYIDAGLCLKIECEEK